MFHAIRSVVWGAPLVLLLLPLPLLIRLFLPPARHHRSAALMVPFYHTVAAGRPEAIPESRFSLMMALAIWSLLIVAAARPLSMSESVEHPRSGRDIMLAVDLSASMEMRDFLIDDEAVDRLAAVKLVVSDFIERREGDRIGLIFFADKAYVASPLTYDLNTVARLLDEAELHMIGTMTAIGDAIGLGVKRLHDQMALQKVLILLSDGNDTSGILPAQRSAHFAALEGLQVYTIGIGAGSRRGGFGESDIDHSGMMNETTLRAIAQLSDGRFFRATDYAQLTRIYALIDELEPRVSGREIYRQVKEWYIWPLGAALLLSLLMGTVMMIWTFFSADPAGIRAEKAQTR